VTGAAAKAPSLAGAAAVASSTAGVGQDFSKENLLKLGLKPVGCGVYPARITSTSPYDVRVVEVELTAQSLGQSCSLELECPARQQVSQHRTLHSSISCHPHLCPAC